LALTGANFTALFTPQGALCMKRTIAKLAKTLGTPVSVAAALTLLSSWAYADLIFEHDGHTYKLVELPATWHEATAAANAMTLGDHVGYLARIDSAAENQAILEAVSEHLSPAQRANSIPNDGSETAFVWLGGSDAEREGRWIWSSNGDPFWQGNFNGSPVGGRYTNWGVQPDNVGGVENSLAIGLADWPAPFYDLGATGQWNDLEAGNSLVYIVEFDALSEPFTGGLQEPVNNGVHSGVGMIRGWAVSGEPVERVEVYVDGEYAFDIPYGDPRADIGNKYPDNDMAATSGFSVPFRYSALSAGNHTVSVVVTDQFGEQMERSATFEVVRFDKPYIGKADTPDLNWSFASSLSDYIVVRGVSVGEESYSITLQWQTRTQKFEIVSISKD
jgi:hypothetical protein